MLPQDFLQLLTAGVGIDRQTAQRKVRIHARRRGDAFRGPVRTKAAHTHGGMPSVMAAHVATAVLKGGGGLVAAERERTQWQRAVRRQARIP